jgi:hypothetical protein
MKEMSALLMKMNTSPMPLTLLMKLRCSAGIRS